MGKSKKQWSKIKESIIIKKQIKMNKNYLNINISIFTDILNLFNQIIMDNLYRYEKYTK
jgi:hypothetical protein